MNVSSILKVEEKITVSAALAFTPRGIPNSSFSDSAEPLHQVAAFGILEQIGLDGA